MRDDVFADGIGEITVTGTTVRIDLVSLSATERDADNKPKSVFRQRIVMPVAGGEAADRGRHGQTAGANRSGAGGPAEEFAELPLTTALERPLRCACMTARLAVSAATAEFR
jgi:hypothetical protein